MTISAARTIHSKIYLLLGVLLLVSLLTLTFGETPWTITWEGLVNRMLGSSQEWNPLLDERLPRLIVLICTGASLAVSGAVMQALFHNPLASPSVLGISCGGCLCVTLVLISGWYLTIPLAIPMAAFIGCFATLLCVYTFSRSKGEVNISNLILTGIAISTLLVAIQSAILYSIREQWQLIQIITEWEAGSTIDRSWKHVHMQLPLTLIGLTGCWVYSKEIDILSLGDEEALNLGVDVKKVRWRLFLCIALLTGGSIAAVGIIAFFGLILPHVIRNLYGSSNQVLIPFCTLGGSVVLSTLDLGLRFFHIQAFSIGNISAIIGGLFFLTLLMRSRHFEIHGSSYA